MLGSWDSGYLFYWHQKGLFSRISTLNWPQKGEIREANFWPFLNFFLGNLKLILSCNSEVFKIIYIYIFFTVQKCNNFNWRSKILQIFIFLLFENKNCHVTFLYILGVFCYVSHHGRSAFFLAYKRLSIQYLHLTIRCLYREKLMSVMKHFVMFICMSVCA